MILESSSLLKQAQSGTVAAVGQLLEHFKPYLIVLAQRQLDERLRGRLDPMDVVQTTFLEAHRDFAQFEGDNIEALLAWLRQILKNNIASAHQTHLNTQKRSARLESNFVGVSPSGMNQDLGDVIPSESTSPSQRAMKNEVAASLAISMNRLPEFQAEAVRLRYLEGLSLAEISRRMGKSEVAVAGLLKRGLKGLRIELKANQLSSSAGM